MRHLDSDVMVNIVQQNDSFDKRRVSNEVNKKNEPFKQRKNTISQIQQEKTSSVEPASYPQTNNVGMKTFYKRQVSNLVKRPTSNFSFKDNNENEPVSATFARRQIISKMAQTSPMIGKKKPVIVSKADIIKAVETSSNSNFAFQQASAPTTGLSTQAAEY